MIFYQNIAELLFFVFILLIAAGSFVVVRTRILMHTVLGLAVALLGVAGIYFYLGSMLLTLMQILIYVGAICIVLVFGIMVGHTPTEIAEKHIKEKKGLLLAACAAGTAFFLLLAGVLKTDWIPAAATDRDFSVAHVGQSFLYNYCLAFELISVILLVAIVGAIILARGDQTGMDGDELLPAAHTQPGRKDILAAREKGGERSS